MQGVPPVTRRQAHLAASDSGTAMPMGSGTCHLPKALRGRHKFKGSTLMLDKDRWRRRDHKFAVGTIALMVFLVVAGFTSWMLNSDSSKAAPTSSYRSPR
jgi:hypothetical protein